MDRQKAKAMRRRSTALFMSDPTMDRQIQRLQQITADENRAKLEEGGLGGGLGGIGDGLGTASFQVDSGARQRAGPKRRQSALFVSKPGGIGSSQEPIVDEKVMQQLRGIFAAHDEDKDLKLNQTQLGEAVQALGFSPTDDLLARFMQRRPEKRGRLIDLPTFLLVAGEELAKERKQSSDMIELFKMFEEGEGLVTAQMLRHILHETLTPERLSQAELEEFMIYSGILKQGAAHGRGGFGGRGLHDKLIDYRELLNKLSLF